MYQNNYYNRDGIDNRKGCNNYKNDVKGIYNNGYIEKYEHYPNSNKYTNNINSQTYTGHNKNNFYNFKQKKSFDYKYTNSKRSRSPIIASGTDNTKRVCNIFNQDKEQTKMLSSGQCRGLESNADYPPKEKGNNNIYAENYKDYYTYKNKYKEDYVNNYKGGNYNYRDNYNYRNNCNFKKDGYRDEYITHKYGMNPKNYESNKHDNNQHWQKKSPVYLNSAYDNYKKRYYHDNLYRRPYNEDYHYSKYDRSVKRTKLQTDKYSDKANTKATTFLSGSKNNKNKKHMTTYNTMKKRENYFKTSDSNHVSNKRRNSYRTKNNSDSNSNKSNRKRAKRYDSSSDEYKRKRKYVDSSDSYLAKRRNRKRNQLSSTLSRHGDTVLRKKRMYNKERDTSLIHKSNHAKKSSWSSAKKGHRDKRHRSGDSGYYSEEGKKRKKRNDASESASLSSNASMDKIVHFSWKEGMILDNIYRIEKKMGDGTFGRVLLCKNLTTQEEYAIKVIRNKKRYTKSAKIEADILKKIQNNNPQNNNIVKYYGKFMHKNHMCLIFEPLGPSLYEILKRNEFHGFPLEDIKCFCIEILKSLRYLRKIRLTHTDIKPENILLDDVKFQGKTVTIVEHSDKREIRLYRTKSTGIRLIDFGSATFSEDYHGSIINTRQYRAPEVILNLGWNEASDMWSLGCVLVEMYTGYLLFKTHDHLEHLALMESRLGPIPKRMLVDALKTNGVRYIHRHELRINWPEGAESSYAESYVRHCAPLSDIIRNKEFCDFLKFILEIDPRRRPTPSDALRHKFLQNVTRKFP